jgi:CRP-like cAMP-binding protein
MATFLSQSAPFAGLPAHEIEAFASVAQEERHRARCYIFMEGDPSRWFYLFKSGHVKILRNSAYIVVAEFAFDTYPPRLLVNTHAHLLLVGFMLMLVMGVATWMFPRPGRDDTSYRPGLAEAVYWVMTVAAALRALAEMIVALEGLLALRWLMCPPVPWLPETTVLKMPGCSAPITSMAPSAPLSIVREIAWSTRRNRPGTSILISTMA